jgi:hypothetical protein
VTDGPNTGRSSIKRSRGGGSSEAEARSLNFPKSGGTTIIDLDENGKPAHKTEIMRIERMSDQQLNNL